MLCVKRRTGQLNYEKNLQNLNLLTRRKELTKMPPKKYISGYGEQDPDAAAFLRPSKADNWAAPKSGRTYNGAKGGYEAGAQSMDDGDADFLNRVDFNFQDNRGGDYADVLTNVEKNQLQDESGGRTGPIKNGVGGGRSPRNAGRKGGRA